MPKKDFSVQDVAAHESAISSLTLSSDSELVSTASSDGAVRVWSAGTGDCIHQLTSKSGRVRGVAFSTGSTLIVSSATYTAVQIQRVDDGSRVRELERPSFGLYTISFSANSAFLAVG